MKSTAVKTAVKRSTGHTHTPTENNTPDTDTHTHDKNNTPNPQTNISHKHLTTLEGGATTVRATSHARVGGCAERPTVKTPVGLGIAQQHERGAVKSPTVKTPAGLVIHKRRTVKSAAVKTPAGLGLTMSINQRSSVRLTHI